MDYIICKPVMLPQTGELQLPSICIGTSELGLRYTDIKFGYGGTIYQHLYLVSDEEIKEGDWCLHRLEGIPETDLEAQLRVSHAINTMWKMVKIMPKDRNQKIIATTDKSLSLPMIPSSFIEEWVAKEGKVNKVKVGFNHLSINGVNQISSEVIILPIEDKIYSRENLCTAVIDGIREFGQFLRDVDIRTLKDQDIKKYANDWFKENY